LLVNIKLSGGGIDADIREEVLGGRGDLLVGQAAEDLSHNVVQRLLVVGFQLILVLGLELLLLEVQIDGHLLVLLKLHDDKGIPRLPLTERRVQAYAEHAVYLIGLGKDHKLLDSLVLDLVVVCLAAQPERGLVHVDIKPASAESSQ
jgi:hypothetical protein